MCIRNEPNAVNGIIAGPKTVPSSRDSRPDVELPITVDNREQFSVRTAFGSERPCDAPHLSTTKGRPDQYVVAVGTPQEDRIRPVCHLSGSRQPLDRRSRTNVDQIVRNIRTVAPFSKIPPTNRISRVRIPDPSGILALRDYPIVFGRRCRRKHRSTV